MNNFQIAVVYLIPGMLLFLALLLRNGPEFQKALKSGRPILAQIIGCVLFVVLWPMAGLYVIRNLLNRILPG